MTNETVIRTSNGSNVASDRETVRRLSGDLALARNCLSNLLFAESALDKELARREARRFLGHPSTEPALETEVTPPLKTRTCDWPDTHVQPCDCSVNEGKP